MFKKKIYNFVILGILQKKFKYKKNYIIYFIIFLSIKK